MVDKRDSISYVLHLAAPATKEWQPSHVNDMLVIETMIHSGAIVEGGHLAAMIMTSFTLVPVGPVRTRSPSLAK